MPSAFHQHNTITLSQHARSHLQLHTEDVAASLMLLRVSARSSGIVRECEKVVSSAAAKPAFFLTPSLHHHHFIFGSDGELTSVMSIDRSAARSLTASF